MNADAPFSPDSRDAVRAESGAGRKESAGSAVITGIGVVASCGTGVADFFRGLRQNGGFWRTGTFLHEKAMPLSFLAVDEALFGGARRFSAHDTLVLARAAARQALAMACDMDTGVLGLLGVCVGTTSGSSLHFLGGYEQSRTAWQSGNGGKSGKDMLMEDAGKEAPSMDAGLAKALPDDVRDYFSCNLSLALAGEIGAAGPLHTISTACTSGADAMGLGLDLVRTGQCDAVLCGGADALSVVPHAGFARMLIYSDEPCRPFDRDRKGLNLGEGAAFFVLEREDRAARRGARTFGRISGWGSACDASHLTAPREDGRGLRRAVQAALDDASCPMDALAFINAHGTATHDNDRVEGRVLHELFPEVPVWATKPCTGHTLGAAGAIEAVATLLALNNCLLPATFGFENVDPETGLVPTRDETRPRGRAALSTSLGFGGGNSVLVLEGVEA